MTTPAPKGGSIDELRRRNWIAIGVATVLMMFSTLSYAAAFADDGSDANEVDGSLVALGAAMVPFVFIALGFISRNPQAPRRVLQAMGLLVLIALSVGLIDPLLGASSGFAFGGALVLNRPDVERVMLWRLGAASLSTVYVLFLLVAIPAAGVFSASVLPLLLLGFADEYAAWSAVRTEELRAGRRADDQADR